METIMKVLIALCCFLLVFLVAISIFFLKYQPPIRSRSPGGHGSAGSSSRSRMAARLAHMERGSRRGLDDAHMDDDQPEDDQMEETINPSPNQFGLQPDDFGGFGRLDPAHRARSQGSLGSSLVGSGPNGTRTLLMGWFGLDEPTSAGYNTRPETKEKHIDGDVLPMRATRGSHLEDPYQPQSVVPHHRVPTTDDHDWETQSEAADV